MLNELFRTTVTPVKLTQITYWKLLKNKIMAASPDYMIAEPPGVENLPLPLELTLIYHHDLKLVVVTQTVPTAVV